MIAEPHLNDLSLVICSNLSLNFNSVGFYQIMKIAITPAVIVLEFLMFSKGNN